MHKEDEHEREGEAEGSGGHGHGPDAKVAAEDDFPYFVGKYNFCHYVLLMTIR